MLWWQNVIRPRRGTCQADTVLGEVFSGNLQATSGIFIVQNALQLVFKQFRTWDPVLGTWPQHGAGKCSWRTTRKSNVKFRKTTVTNELRLELCFPTFSRFPKHCLDRSYGEGVRGCTAPKHHWASSIALRNARPQKIFCVHVIKARSICYGSQLVL